MSTARPVGTEPRELSSRLLLLLALLLVAGVYANALDGPFIWDDRHLVLDERRALDLGEAFGRPFFGGTSVTYFRPLTTLSLALDLAIHGENSAGFHLTNLALHLVTTALLFGLLRRRGSPAQLAFLCSLLWALAPRLTEGAAWISGRGDVLASALSLAALWVYRPSSLLKLAFALAFAFLALLSKEMGIAAFAALLILALTPQPLETERAGAGSTRHRQRWLRAALIAAPFFVYVLLRLRAGAVNVGDGMRLGGLGRSLAFLEALGRYAFMLVNPLQPRSLIGQLGQPSWPYLSAGAAVLAVLVAALVRWRRRPLRASPQTLAFGALAAVPLVMVLHLTALPITVVAADRYLYLPAAALLVAVVPALDRLVARGRRYTVVLLLLVGACGARTFQRVGDYADEARFWTEAARTTPREATAWIELGSVAYRASLFEDALRLYRDAVPLPGPRVGRALDNAALLAAVSGKRALADELGDALITRFPDSAEFRLRRASIALNALDFAAARRHGERALAMDVGSPKARSFMVLLGGLEAANRRNTPADAQHVDMKAFRYPELEQRTAALLEAPKLDEALVRAGLDFLIANSDPRRVVPLLQRYSERSTAPDVQRLHALLELRLETARSVKQHLQTL